MPVEEDKVLESVEAAADPPARRTRSKAAASSDTSFTPMKATRPTLPKPTPTSSRNKGKAAVRNVDHTGESSPAASARKRRQVTPLMSTLHKRARHAYDGKELLWPVSYKKWGDVDYLETIRADLKKFLTILDARIMELNPVEVSDNDSEINFWNAQPAAKVAEVDGDDGVAGEAEQAISDDETGPGPAFDDSE
jgi:hypothetical protein